MIREVTDGMRHRRHVTFELVGVGDNSLAGGNTASAHVVSYLGTFTTLLQLDIHYHDGSVS